MALVADLGRNTILLIVNPRLVLSARLPETAKWLNRDEKALAARRLETEGSHNHGKDLTWTEAKATLTDWRLYAHYDVSLLCGVCW